MVKLYIVNRKRRVSSVEVYANINKAPEQYNRWMNKHIIENGIEGTDFIDKINYNKNPPGRSSRELLLTIDFAKGLCQSAMTPAARKLRAFLLTL